MSCKKLLKALLASVMLFLSLFSFAQDKVISGKVTDATGAGVAGVNVTAKGSTTGTQTGTDGAYRLSVPAAATELVFSSVGFTTQEVSISGKTTVDVSMVTATASLGEVVVIGYGTAKKKDLTGAVSVISSKDFVKGQITTPEQLIAGKVAGVQITSNGGAPGSGSTIRIRGGASLNASNDPLIVIDGIPVDNAGVSGSPNPLSLINPNDIESFNILKDASASAIYGSRASNGVIIITTKKGRSGAAKFNFNTQVSAATPVNKVDVLSAGQLRTLVNSSERAPQYAPLLGGANTDWQDEIYHTAIATDNNLSITGATKNMPYRFSIGYLNQDGILRTGNLQRTSVGISLSPKFFEDHLRVDINIKGSASKSRFANQGAIGASVFFDPTQPVYTDKTTKYLGYFEYLDPSSETGLLALSPRNPVSLLEQRNDRSTVLRSIGNIALDYKFHFLPELRANLNLGYDVSQGTGTIVVNDSAAMSYKRYKDLNGVYHGGVNNHYSQYKDNAVVEFYLNYAKELKGISSRIDVTAGTGYYDFITTTINSPDYTSDGTIVSAPKFNLDKPQYTLMSYYGRLNYTFNDKYLLTAAVRTDGSSRFAQENRWGVFPSAAFAWRMSQEGFLRNSRTISELKLRLGYGVTGQQDGIGYYDYISYYNLSNNTAQYQLGNQFYNLYRPGGYYAARKWEETSTYNVGLDYGLFNNRINGSIEVYYKKTKDLLNSIGQSAGTNFSNTIVANVGDMENRGAEFLVNADVIRGKDLTWNVSFNATYNKNEITKLTISDDPTYPGAQYGGISGGTGQTILINSVGAPRGSFYVYQQIYDPATGKPIDGLFEDRNRDGIVNDKDLYKYKNSDPRFFFGFSTGLTYKKWNAGFVMRANLDNYVYNNIFSNSATTNAIFQNGFLGNASTELLYSGISGTRNGYSLSDYYVQNGSFIRMDNINLGYSVGQVFQKKATLRLNANVQNVFVITKYKGLDPEISGGIDNNFYPRPRTFVLGANLDF
jgi:TonB-dependent starch-binding outer membrane protein SusC